MAGKKGKITHSHKKKIGLRLASYLLFVIGIIAAFWWAYGKADVILVSGAGIVGLLGGLSLCAHLHGGAKIAGIAGVWLLAWPFMLENQTYWQAAAAFAVVASWYIGTHE